MGAPAPLISTDQAPAPQGGEAEWFHGADRAPLRAAWFPLHGARGSVIVSPGRTEPIEKYFEVVDELRSRGFAVLVHDWRGQGLSHRMLADRLRGHAEGLDPFLSDHSILLDAFAGRMPRPWIALAHSMGGALVLAALVRGESRLDAAILTAPMVGVPTGAPSSAARLVVSAMRMLGRSTANVFGAPDPLAETFANNQLTHDPVRYQRYKAQLKACPDLAVGGLTWAWLDFALDVEAAVAAPGALEVVTIPTAIVAAGEEHIVLSEPIRTTARRLPNCSYVEVPGARHEILMETDDKRAIFWTAFDALAAEVSPPRA